MDIFYALCVLAAVAGRVCVAARNSSSSSVPTCLDLSVRTHEKHCNPALGELTTQILAARGGNFTRLCR